MKKTIALTISFLMLLESSLPVLAQNGNGQNEESVGSANREEAVIQINKTNDEENLTQEQNQNEIQKVIINRGEDDQLQVKTENQEQEQQEYQTGDGEQILFQLNLENEGEDTQLRIRKNDDGDTFIEEDDMTVKANFPMSIDAETGLITITNSNGKEIELKEKPSSVLSQVLGDKLLDTVNETELVLGEGDKIRYEFKGTDKMKFLGLFEINVPITASINCENLDDIETVKPWYLNWFSFLFTNN